MKLKISILLGNILLLFSTSCNNSSSNTRNSDEIEESYAENDAVTDGYKDGTYCAEVEYYNPSTGTRSTYDLDVEVENQELTVVHWPNGGWLDDTHFSPEDISDGACTFVSDRGYRYTITIRAFGGCTYTDEYKIRRDVNSEIEATTCKKCGREKSGYGKYCYSCKRKIEDEEENTCSRCGSYEYGVYGGLCSSCKRDEDDEQ